ncbi:unnamed protein product, partial [Nippostrongylus brasiliensis]|uniref:ADP,ATP carrier protein n=1 Tax=Nippostrongylus brasiliensis TaxID=27835 RepID=A0A0N4XRC1_NIPBR
DFAALGKRRTLADEVKSFVKSGALIGVAFCFMAYSSCLGIVFPKESILADYAIAQSFRSSHYFVSMLSEDVYQKLLPLGGAIAVLASFTVSSLLHGFNFQISAVLLSLGVACYFENSE